MSKPLVIGTIVGVVGLFALGGFLLWQQSQPQAGLRPSSPTPAPSSQPQTIDTSAWQTYRNEEFGFEVKYPQDWFNNTEDEVVKSYHGGAGVYIFSNQYFQSFTKEFDVRKKNAFFLKIVTLKEGPANEDNFLLLEKLRGMKGGEEFSEDLITGEKVIYTKIRDEFVGSASGVRFKFRRINNNQDEIETDLNKFIFPSSDIIQVDKGDVLVQFVLYGDTQETVDRNLDTFDQILSTFRFVE